MEIMQKYVDSLCEKNKSNGWMELTEETDKGLR